MTSVRALNRARILILIRRSPGLMRAEVSQLTVLSKATVSSLVEDLVANRFVSEDSRNGERQRRVGLYLNRNAGAAVGFDVLPGECRGISADMSMRVLNRSARPLRRN